MKEFPQKFKPENRPNFNKYEYNRLLCYLRQGIYEFKLNDKTEDESEFYSLGNFFNYRNNGIVIPEIVTEIISELKVLGWKCDLVYGGSGLFIYSGERPRTCLPDETNKFSDFFEND